jgi:predicted TIM-barrel fold metal-dependent hydrolase
MTYTLFSVDDHIIEPAHVWSDRLPQRMREDGPHVIEAEGREFWVFEGQRTETMGLNAVAGKPREEWSLEPTRFTDMIPGCYDPLERVKDMDRDGIAASLCFPSFPRFGGVTFLRAGDKALAAECVKSYNDFVLDEWCAAAPGRFVPMIIGMLWDPVAMAAEVRRCAAKGARALSFVDNPANLGLPSFHSDAWDPVWEAVTETDTVVCMHIGSGGAMHMPSPDGPFTVGISLATLNAEGTCTDILLSRIPGRFPTIKMALSEGGIGWVPFALERADRVWERHRHWAGHDDTPPSEHFRRTMWVCFIEERTGIDLRHTIGIDKIMWECDYPHADTPWPDSQAAVSSSLAGVPVDEVAKLTHGNAAELFRWPVEPVAV